MGDAPIPAVRDAIGAILIRRIAVESISFAAITGSRLTYLVLLVLGTALCTPGIGKTARLGLWMHPISFAGYILGAAALLLIVQGLFRLQIVPVSSGMALALIGGIVVIKIVLAALYPAPLALK
jgi:hypothetical protein